MAIGHETTLLSDSVLPQPFRQRVLSFEREGDWDGEGADPIARETCRAALEFVQKVQAVRPNLPLPISAPSVHGAISLRWVNGDRDLAIHIYSADRVEAYFQQPDGRYALLPQEPAQAIERLLAFEPQPR